MELSSKQKRFLKAQAHDLKPIIQIGKGGLQNEQQTSIREALDRRELIKITLLQNTDEDAKEIASLLEEQLAIEVVQIIGRTLVLYKKSSREKYRKISNEVQAL